MAKPGELTPKQRRFVEAYTGNGVQAARAAGYKGNDKTLSAVAVENLAKPLIIAALKKRETKRLRPLIATREERQRFWSKMQRSKDHSSRDRLRASELLGKSEGDFTENLQVSGPNGGAVEVQFLTYKNGSELPDKEGE